MTVELVGPASDTSKELKPIVFEIDVLKTKVFQQFLTFLPRHLMKSDKPAAIYLNNTKNLPDKCFFTHSYRNLQAARISALATKVAPSRRTKYLTRWSLRPGAIARTIYPISRGHLCSICSTLNRSSGGRRLGEAAKWQPADGWTQVQQGCSCLWGKAWCWCSDVMAGVDMDFAKLLSWLVLVRSVSILK